MILVLHVAAIAAIFIHNRVTDDEVIAQGDTPAPSTASVAVRPDAGQQAMRERGENFYFVATGDTYERIARQKGVDVNDLRDLNNNKSLGPGIALRIPAGAVPPAEFVPTSAPEPTPDPTPAITPVQPATVVEPHVAEPAVVNPPVYVRREEPAPAIRVEPMRVTPNRNPSVPVVSDPVAPPVNTPPVENTPRVVEAPPVAVPVTVSYTVKSGDTAWGIAKRNGVSVKSLLEANGIKDARKLRIGMKLEIPQ